MSKTRITVAKGDGIGPEIMDATLKIIMAAGAQIEIDEIEVGEKVYLSGNTAGISKEAWDIIIRNKIFLKAPITTPQGGGYKSLNVTTRKTLGLYANVRPCRSLHPFVETKHPVMDVVIIRENEEDLYAGIEHQQTDEVVQCLKLISRPGSEKIVRYAFEYARAYNRKKVTCFTKDNIMKQTDGLFHKVFDEIGAEYPDIEKEHWIVDIGAAKLADTPEAFDVIVMPNLYGDVLSDVAAQITGSVGLAGSANIGDEYAMFEAIHGSAPRRAGQNVANPSGLLQGAILMLIHIGQGDVAEKVQNAWLKTLEDGIHTYDIYKEGISKKKVSTSDFADAVIERLGQKPQTLKPVSFKAGTAFKLPKYERKAPAKKDLVGVDLFVHWSGFNANEIGKKLETLNKDNVYLDMITNRGVKVYPDGFEATFCTDHWRCRFKTNNGQNLTKHQIIDLLTRAEAAGIDVIKTENLYYFNGERAFSLGQGQ
ncbi:NADP-dependent isocitrate dehydrogenase [Schleiferia thermophila]|jgi:isocitrate dehydrogenase|uniref:Isocitrate dehydrogenase [NADP] n=1 Tax=Schleiferia thermophila TaxID=884107 RepID=A0A369A2Y6_9FLAO|nr:NADP-dependent isocitrate dehydrogenase [Schleiferia thermophila]KFD38880.1 isocitrate dehydrogenase [Schleiferia thermophila str. Yellowstone]PMB33238.1 isocitrate dehydrogenase [Fischerella thermalis CCMEE 5319]RCX03672.1 isocitrate dehydrogenase [Schleiferia thermophila]GCD79906.1 isocitrate dehydrogenase [Schleiferia thermophila]